MEINKDKKSLAEQLLSASKEIKKNRLMNLGGDKEFNDWLKVLANTLKVSSFALEGRIPIFNVRGETCTLFVVKTLNSILKTLPNEIAEVSLVGLQKVLGIGKVISAVIDALANYKKVIKDKTVIETLVLIMYEFLKMYARAWISSTIFGNLWGTKLQFLIGPIIYLAVNYLYIPEDSYSPEMDFVRDAAEEMIDAIRNHK